jgi:hypothetical protein
MAGLVAAAIACAPPVQTIIWKGTHSTVKLGNPPCIKIASPSSKDSAGTYLNFPAQRNTEYVVVLDDGRAIRTVKVRHLEVLTERR